MEDQEHYLRHNAHVLADFLKRLMPNKDRWFFPSRARRMTLNEKATSAVESLHQSMKFSSGKVVTPSMSLCESLRTMHTQAEPKLRETRIAAVRQASTTSLWGQSPTMNEVSKLCESQIMTQRQQAAFYTCHIEQRSEDLANVPSKIWVKRLPFTDQWCSECKKPSGSDITQQSGRCCPEHCQTSPLPRFLRIREVQV